MILYATPMVALIPFILSMMGFGFAPKVLVVFLFAVFPILYNTVEGARSIKPELIEVARSFRSSEWALWREVMLPYTLPFTMTGMRQAIGRGLVGMVAAEFFLSSTGLGQVIMMASQNFDTAGVFGMILLIGLLGVGLMPHRPRNRKPLRALAELVHDRSFPHTGSRRGSPQTCAAISATKRQLQARIADRRSCHHCLCCGNSWCARLRPPMSPSRPACILAIPNVIVDPAFLEATAIRSPPSPRASLISIVLGTLIGLLIGRSLFADRFLRHYINFFYACRWSSCCR